MKKWGFVVLVLAAVLAVFGGIWVFINMEKDVKVVSADEKSGTPETTALKMLTYSPSPGNATPSSEPQIDRKNTLRITAVGDILLGRGVGGRLQKDKKGYIYPFEKVVHYLKEGDIVFGNLEEPITSSQHGLLGIREGGKYVLKNEVEAFNGIKYAGFNLLNLANNHILDYYDIGLNDTIRILDQNQIAHSGAGKDLEEARKLAIIEKKGVKVGMLSYTDMSEVLYKGNPPIRFRAEKDRYGVAPRNYDYIREDIEKAKGQVDLLIISLHWGKEESFDVLPEQVEMSHKLLDQGADIILGHHPHQFQGIEIYKGKPIIYSLGNFIFDQNDPENQEAFILQMDFEKKRLTNFYAIPIKTVNKTQVVVPEGAASDNLLKREAELCLKLNTPCEIKENKLIFKIN
ncbi:MAG: CapA family protein [Clostridia bacterium]|nr:CapA family protein [Clostridia bacterium]